MKKTVLISLVASVFFVSNAAAAWTSKDYDTTKYHKLQSSAMNSTELAEWFYSFEDKKDFQHMPAALNGMRKVGLFEKTTGQSLLIGFFSQVFAFYPDKSEAFIRKFEPKTKNEFFVLNTSIYYAQSKNMARLMHYMQEKPTFKEYGEASFKIFNDKDVVTDLRTRIPDSLSNIDVLTGAYSASGKNEYLYNLAQALPGGKYFHPDQAKLGLFAKISVINIVKNNPLSLSELESIAKRDTSLELKKEIDKIVDNVRKTNSLNFSKRVSGVAIEPFSIVKKEVAD